MESLNWIHALLFVFASLFGALIRLPFSIWKSGIASDSMGVFSKIYGLSKKGRIRYDIHDAINFDGFFPRPALFHYLISRFPRKYWRLFAVLLNISFDVLSGWIVLVLSFLMLSDNKSIADPWTFSILGLFIFYSTPLLLPISARLKATNNRTMGLFITTCYFLCLHYSQYYPILYLALFVFLYLSLIASTFAFQSIVFFTPLVCLIGGSYVQLLFVAIGFILLYFLPFTQVKSIVDFKWQHIKHYNQNLKNSNSTKDRRFLINSFVFLFAPNGLTKKQRLFLYDAPLLILIYSLPFLLIFVKWIFNDLDWTILQAGKLRDGSLQSFCIIMGISSFILFVLTSIGKGKIFGESERYFEFSLPFLTALFVVLLEFNNPLDFVLVSSLIFFQIGITVFVHFLSINNSLPSLFFFRQDPEVEEIVQWLSEHSPSANVATVPIRFGRALSSQQLYSDNVRCKFYYQMIAPKGKIKEGWDRYRSEVYNKNTFKISPTTLKERYGVELMIVNNEFLEKRNPQYLGLLKDYEEVKVSRNFSVYKLTV